MEFLIFILVLLSAAVGIAIAINMSEKQENIKSALAMMALQVTVIFLALVPLAIWVSNAS